MTDAAALRAPTDPREESFLHGGDYAGHVDRPRPERCSTCAFRPRGPTVRPAGTPLADLVRMTAGYDSFVCHERHGGETLTCRGWLAHHRPGALVRDGAAPAREDRA